MSSMSGRLWRSILLMVIVLAGSVETAAAQAITVAEGIYLGWAPFYVADARRLWEKQGLSVTPIPFAAGRLALDAIVGGRAAFGTVAETPVIFAAINGIPVRIIGHMNTHETFDLVAIKDIRTLGDVRGRKIGYLQGTNSQYYLHRMLQRVNLKMADITPVSMTPTDMVTALSKGDIDGFIWAEPHISLAVAAAKGRVHVIRTPGLYRAYSCIVTLQSVIESQPQVLVKGLRVLMDAVDVIRKQPDEAIAIAADKTKMDADIAKKAWADIDYGIELGPRLVADMEEQAKWAIETTRPGAKMPDFSKIVVTDLLAQAKKK